MIQLTTSGDGVLLPVKVVPGASRDRIVGELDGALKITVAAAPEKGAANKAVCRVIASALGLRVPQVTIAAGTTNPRKTVHVIGVSLQALRDGLGIEG